MLLRILTACVCLATAPAFAHAQPSPVMDNGDLIELPRYGAAQRKAWMESSIRAGMVHQLGVNLRSLYQSKNKAFFMAKEEEIKEHFRKNPALVGQLEAEAKDILLEALRTYFTTRKFPGILGSYISGLGIRYHTDIFLFPKETILAEDRVELSARDRAKAIIETSIRQAQYQGLLRKINKNIQRFRLLKTTKKKLRDATRNKEMLSQDLLFQDTVRKEEILWKPIIYWFDRYTVNLDEIAVRSWFARKIAAEAKERQAFVRKAGGKLDFIYMDNVSFSEDGMIRAPRPSRKVKGRIVQEIYYHPFPESYEAFLKDLRPRLHALGLKLIGNIGGLIPNLFGTPAPALLDGLSLEQALDERILLNDALFRREILAYQTWLAEGKWILPFPLVRTLAHRHHKQRALLAVGLFTIPLDVAKSGIFAIHRTPVRGYFFDWPAKVGSPTSDLQIQSQTCALPGKAHVTRFLLSRSFQRASLTFDFAQYACNLAKVGLAGHASVKDALACFCGETPDASPYQLSFR